MDSEIKYDHAHHPSEENLRKLELSMAETEGLEVRVLRCPICGFPAMWVYSDRSGHVNFKCRKCKFCGPINLGYFSRRKQTGKHIYAPSPDYETDGQR